jgi:hypothetical protein
LQPKILAKNETNSIRRFFFQGERKKIFHRWKFATNAASLEVEFRFAPRGWFPSFPTLAAQNKIGFAIVL